MPSQKCCYRSKRHIYGARDALCLKASAAGGRFPKRDIPATPPSYSTSHHRRLQRADRPAPRSAPTPTLYQSLQCQPTASVYP
jgi:hypothetical protein